MRVFSVVFVLATLTIFGVMAQDKGCSLECPESDNTDLVCNFYDQYTYTSTRCESDKLVHCAQKVENKVVTVKDGACALHTRDNCQHYCPEGKPVCGKRDGKFHTYGSFCSYLNDPNCEEVQDIYLSQEYPTREFKALYYGECP